MKFLENIEFISQNSKSSIQQSNPVGLETDWLIRRLRFWHALISVHRLDDSIVDCLRNDKVKSENWQLFLKGQATLRRFRTSTGFVNALRCWIEQFVVDSAYQRSIIFTVHRVMILPLAFQFDQDT